MIIDSGLTHLQLSLEPSFGQGLLVEILIALDHAVILALTSLTRSLALARVG